MEVFFTFIDLSGRMEDSEPDEEDFDDGFRRVFFSELEYPHQWSMRYDLLARNARTGECWDTCSRRWFCRGMEMYMQYYGVQRQGCEFIAFASSVDPEGVAVKLHVKNVYLPSTQIAGLGRSLEAYISYEERGALH